MRASAVEFVASRSFRSRPASGPASCAASGGLAPHLSPRFVSTAVWPLNGLHFLPTAFSPETKMTPRPGILQNVRRLFLRQSRIDRERRPRPDQQARRNPPSSTPGRFSLSGWQPDRPLRNSRTPVSAARHAQRHPLIELRRRNFNLHWIACRCITTTRAVIPIHHLKKIFR